MKSLCCPETLMEQRDSRTLRALAFVDPGTRHSTD